MTIKYVKGDATNPQGPGTKVIVHCCNDIGSWGAGFVLALSAKWPEPESSYKALWNRWAFGISESNIPLGIVDYVKVEKDIYVANLIGQEGVGYPAGGGVPPIRYDAINKGLRNIRLRAEVSGEKVSIHMPRMGAGLAGGDWLIIERLVELNLADYGFPVTVYDL